MGLSDSERYTKLAFSISMMYEMPRFSEWDKSKRLNAVLDNIWTPFLGSSSNGLHWIVGSDTDASYFSNPGMLFSAFEGALYEVRKEEQDKRTNRMTRILTSNPDAWYSFIPGTSDLLRMCGEDYKNLWLLLKHTENVFYALNRYQDGFSDSFPDLRKDICEIQGIIFGIISDDESFLKAWMLNTVISRVLPISLEPDNDFVVGIFDKFNCHHAINMNKVSFAWVERLFKKAQKGVELWNTSSRLGILLRLMGSSFHYEHEHKKLLSLIEAHNKKNRAKKNTWNRIQENRVRAILADSTRKYSSKKTDEEYPVWCLLTNQRIR